MFLVNTNVCLQLYSKTEQHANEQQIRQK